MLSLLLTAIMSLISHAEPLHLVSPASTQLRESVDVSFALVNGVLHAHFEVETHSLNVKPVFEQGDYPFQFDVVELFISVEGETVFPYYEFEVTPLNQTLQVQIPGGKKPYVTGIEAGLVSYTQKTTVGWQADLQIPITQLGWNGNPQRIIGNAFAILGKTKRTYWSLHLPKTKKPKFHKPEYFHPLIK
jgi:hypothetical protein